MYLNILLLYRCWLSFFLRLRRRSEQVLCEREGCAISADRQRSYAHEFIYTRTRIRHWTHPHAHAHGHAHTLPTSCILSEYFVNMKGVRFQRTDVDCTRMNLLHAHTNLDTARTHMHNTHTYSHTCTCTCACTCTNAYNHALTISFQARPSRRSRTVRCASIALCAFCARWSHLIETRTIMSLSACLGLSL